MPDCSAQAVWPRLRRDRLCALVLSLPLPLLLSLSAVLPLSPSRSGVLQLQRDLSDGADAGAPHRSGTRHKAGKPGGTPHWEEPTALERTGAGRPRASLALPEPPPAGKGDLGRLRAQRPCGKLHVVQTRLSASSPSSSSSDRRAPAFCARRVGLCLVPPVWRSTLDR